MIPEFNTPHRIIIKIERNKRQEELPLLHSAMEFFLDELLKRCTIPHKLNIRITLKERHIRDDDGTNNAGLAWRDTIKGEVWYHIHLNMRVPFLELLSTMAHETVHVTQIALGRLKNDGSEWIWDGIEYGSNPYTGKDIDSTLPWEYDAYSKEIDLARKFVKLYYSNW